MSDEQNWNIDQNALADALFSAMPDALVVSDAQGVIKHWNAGAERIFGFTEAEALGESLDIIIPDKQRERHWHGYEQTMRTGQSRYGAGDLLAVPALSKNGARISVQFSITPLKDDSDSMIGMAAIMRDVTEEFEERKRLKKALRNA